MAGYTIGAVILWYVDILFQTRVIIITLFCIVLMVASLVNIKKKTAQG